MSLSCLSGRQHLAASISTRYPENSPLGDSTRVVVRRVCSQLLAKIFFSYFLKKFHVTTPELQQTTVSMYINMIRTYIR